jgi:hypothetical protein
MRKRNRLHKKAKHRNLARDWQNISNNFVSYFPKILPVSCKISMFGFFVETIPFSHFTLYIVSNSGCVLYVTFNEMMMIALYWTPSRA